MRADKRDEAGSGVSGLLLRVRDGGQSALSERRQAPISHSFVPSHVFSPSFLRHRASEALLLPFPLVKIAPQKSHESNPRLNNLVHSLELQFSRMSSDL